MVWGGLGAAQQAINGVPIQKESLEWVEPSTRNVTVGHISHDFYQPGTIRPYNDGVLLGAALGAPVAGGLTTLGLIGDDKRNNGSSILLRDGGISLTPERWQVHTGEVVADTKSELDEALGPFRWHVHQDVDTGEKYWDYHRVPTDHQGNSVWHQHRSNKLGELAFTDGDGLVEDDWICFKLGTEPSGYNDPQFHTFTENGLIFIDTSDKPGVMKRAGGPHRDHPNVPGIRMHEDSVS